jgi:hypothetical protein
MYIRITLFRCRLFCSSCAGLVLARCCCTLLLLKGCVVELGCFGHCGWFCGGLAALGGCVFMRWFVCLFICVWLGVELLAADLLCGCRHQAPCRGAVVGMGVVLGF